MVGNSSVDDIDWPLESFHAKLFPEFVSHFIQYILLLS